MAGAFLKRLAAWCAVLLGEYLLVSLLFDAQALRTGHGPLSALHYVGDLGAFGLAAAAATLAMVGPKLTAALARVPAELAQAKTPRFLLVVHGAAYLAFLGVCARLFGAGAAQEPSAAWGFAWIAIGLLVGASWLLLAIPWLLLRQLTTSFRSGLLIGGGAGAAAWLGARASSSIWETTVGPLTLSVARVVLRFFTDDVTVVPGRLSIASGDFAVKVAPECSGFEGIGLILVLLSGYITVERRELRFPRVLTLLPLAVFVVWMANVARIAMLVLVGRYVSPAVAIGGFHSKVGWLLFCVIALGFVWVVGNARAFRLDAATEPDAEQNPATAYLLPFLVFLAASLVTGLVAAEADAFDALYPLRIAGTLVVLYLLRARYRDLKLDVRYQSVALGIAAFAFWRLVAHGGSANAVTTLRQGLAGAGQVGAALWMTARIVGACVAAPVAEELAFRGYLMRRLTAADFAAVDARTCGWPAWLGSSLAFGILHEHDWLAATVAGLAYALAQRLRGRVSDAIVAHAVTNILLTVDALLLGQLRWLT